jgi:hypothetical protein
MEGVTVSKYTQARLQICAENKCTAPGRYNVSADPTFGSFNQTIVFDEELINLLGYNPAAVTLSLCNASSAAACKPADWKALDSVFVTISDPRPPTAELEFNVPDWVAPNGTLTINGSAVSLIGADVAGAEISIKWTVYTSIVGRSQEPPVGTLSAPPSALTTMELMLRC